jgi:hypothetical protein
LAPYWPHRQGRFEDAQFDDEHKWPLNCTNFGGQGRDRTGDLPLFRRTLIPTELPGRKASCASTATLTGLEPATSAVTGRRANQLRHRALLLLRVTASRTPYGIRTRATALKGRRPRPLDEGGQNRISPGYPQHGHVGSQVSLGHQGPNPQTRTQYPVPRAPIAQLVELRTFNPQVLGSSPSGGTHIT